MAAMIALLVNKVFFLESISSISTFLFVSRKAYSGFVGNFSNNFLNSSTLSGQTPKSSTPEYERATAFTVSNKVSASFIKAKSNIIG